MIEPIRFETLLERHHDEIYGYLWRLLRDTVDAEDVTQDVFLRAYKAFPRLRAGSNHRAWLYKIATNCAYTALKNRRRDADRHSPLLDEYHASRLAGPEAQLAHRETIHAIRIVIEELPPKQRAAVIMRYVQELSYAEVADVLACSEDSARANVYQGLRRVRHELQEEG